MNYTFGRGDVVCVCRGGVCVVIDRWVLSSVQAAEMKENIK